MERITAVFKSHHRRSKTHSGRFKDVMYSMNCSFLMVVGSPSIAAICLKTFIWLILSKSASSSGFVHPAFRVVVNFAFRLNNIVVVPIFCFMRQKRSILAHPVSFNEPFNYEYLFTNV
eukprot:UN02829